MPPHRPARLESRRLHGGSPADVDALAERFRAAGFEVRNGPRVIGDGYHEAVVGDPDGVLSQLDRGF